MERKQRTVFQLDTPFSTVQWPSIAPDDQDAILELLCSVLAPVGQHRANSAPAQTKRSRKRKRQEAQAVTQDAHADLQPPAPELAEALLIGLRSVTRQLEAQAARSVPWMIQTHGTAQMGGREEKNGNTKESEGKAQMADARKTDSTSTAPGAPLAAVFVTRASQPSILHDHLPLLVAAASHARQDCPATRLVQLPRGCEERLSAAVGLPSVAFIGLHADAPRAAGLMGLVRSTVPEVRVPWWEEALSGKYRSLKTKAVVTSHPAVVKKMPKTS